MNKAILMGRLTKDPEMRTTQSQIPVASFTLAVDRRFKNQNGERETDFLLVVAWRSNAEFVGNYLKKGTKVVVVGSIQTRNYEDKEGRRVYITEIVADEIHFAESKRSDSDDYSGKNDYNSEKPPAKSESKKSSDSEDDGFVTLDDDDEDTALPFDL